MQKAKVESRIKVYYELTKPKIWYLLVFTAFASAITKNTLLPSGSEGMSTNASGVFVPRYRLN
jgi:heme O synthase-like polyprenyltransferase